MHLSCNFNTYSMYKFLCKNNDVKAHDCRTSSALAIASFHTGTGSSDTE